LCDICCPRAKIAFIRKKEGGEGRQRRAMTGGKSHSSQMPLPKQQSQTSRPSPQATQLEAQFRGNWNFQKLFWLCEIRIFVDKSDGFNWFQNAF
jgi:hypothetical protein